MRSRAPNPSVKIEIKYGVISGEGVCAWVLVEYFLGFHNEHLAIGKITGYLATVIPVVVLYRALKEKRDQQPDGDLATGNGIKAGLVISAIAGVITTAFFWTYKHFINPGWMDRALEFEKAQWANAGVGTEMIDRKVAAFNALNSDEIQVVTGLIGTMVVGLAISLVLTSILKKKSPGPE